VGPPFKARVKSESGTSLRYFYETSIYFFMIKNLILDFGGVLLKIDYDAPVREFRKLGIENFQQLFAQASQSTLMDDFEKGNITEEEFRNEIRKILGKEISNEEINFAWNSVLSYFPEEKMKLLNLLKVKYNLFLLSNTNEIHIKEFEKSISEKYGSNYFHSQFEKIYFSSRMGMRKPDGEIFEFVLKENNLKPAETIFVDDSIQHILGASKLGINALHLDLKKEDLKDLLIREKLI
jgi:FMN phosphatase YigB (HAD superfamily)